MVNRGWAGNDSSDALARLDQDVPALRPDLVVVLIGGNNYGGKKDPKEADTQLKSDLSQIVTKLISSGALVLLLQYPDPKADVMEKVWDHFNLGNQVISDVAMEQKVPTLNLTLPFREAAREHALDELATRRMGTTLIPTAKSSWPRQSSSS